MFTLYLRERFPLPIFGPAALGIAAAAGWTSPAAPTAAAFIYAIVMSALLLLQFRLWDDLEDRAGDSATHPERVLVRTPAAPYRRVLMGLAIANVATCGIAGWPAAVEIALVDLAFYAAYHRTRRRVSDRIWRYSILLLKYPAFVVVVSTTLGPTQPGRLAAAALVAYLTACGYEALHGNVRVCHGGRGGSILRFDLSADPRVVSSNVEGRGLRNRIFPPVLRVLRGGTAVLRTFLAHVTS